MTTKANRLLASVRKLFSDDDRKVVRRNYDATIWRIAPSGEKPVDHVAGSDDIDFIRSLGTGLRMMSNLMLIQGRS